MSTQFRLTQPAVQDIEQIADQVAQRSGLERAEKFLSELDKKFAKIVRFPNLGRQRNEILPGMRSLPLDSYLILYFPYGGKVDILRVVSGYRDLSALFEE